MKKEMLIAVLSLSAVGLVGGAVANTPAGDDFALQAYAPATQMSVQTPSSLKSNGIQMNGFRFNGILINGFRFNGIIINGFRINGILINGFRFNGTQPQAMLPAATRTRPLTTGVAGKDGVALKLEGSRLVLAQQ